MFSYFKKPKLPTTIFVIASSLAFFSLVVFYLILVINSAYSSLQAPGSGDRYYLKNNSIEGDPMITKNPDLKQILAGPIISDRDPSLGNVNAPVTIVLFSDFTCSYCRQQEVVMQKILTNYKDRVRMIWKDYPESKANSLSFQSAQAARCAQSQNKFWAYHDLLFENSDNLKPEVFYQLAKKLNLNEEKFSACLQKGETKKYINENILEANALEINGVPFVYVNDQEIIGQLSVEDLEKIIKLELSKQTDSGRQTSL